MWYFNKSVWHVLSNSGLPLIHSKLPSQSLLTNRKFFSNRKKLASKYEGWQTDDTSLFLSWLILFLQNFSVLSILYK